MWREGEKMRRGRVRVVMLVRFRVQMGGLGCIRVKDTGRC
jgi:hypothetical protein